MTSAIHKFCQLVLKEIIKALFDFPLSNLREMNTSDKKLFALGEMRGLFVESVLKSLKYLFIVVTAQVGWLAHLLVLKHLIFFVFFVKQDHILVCLHAHEVSLQPCGKEFDWVAHKTDVFDEMRDV